MRHVRILNIDHNNTRHGRHQYAYSWITHITYCTSRTHGPCVNSCVRNMYADHKRDDVQMMGSFGFHEDTVFPYETLSDTSGLIFQLTNLCAKHAYKSIPYTCILYDDEVSPPTGGLTPHVSRMWCAVMWCWLRNTRGTPHL